MLDLLQNSLGVTFLITSIFDAIKYHWNAGKVRDVKTSKGHSRQFINVAILNDTVRMAYGISIHDWYIILSSLLAMIFMIELFWMIYLYYPYRSRSRQDFQRPNILQYFINSVIPNRWAKRL
jgi:hypothetical protein